MAGNIRMMNTSSNHTRSSTTSGIGTAVATGLAHKKPRRLWTLHDRSAVSVNLLKANLAQDGCEEAQLNVAKKLLNDVSDDSALVLNENARLAIYWLIKSSEQGNEEATGLLKGCFDSGRGINCQNIIDVQMCLDTPRNEKLTLKAARLLYEKLNNGEDFITTTQLESRLLQIKESKNVSFSNLQNSNESQPSMSESTTPSSSPGKPVEDEFEELINSSVERKQKSLNRTTASGSGKRHRNNSGSSSIAETEDSYKLHFDYHKSHRGIKLTDDEMIRNATIYNRGEIPSISLHSELLLVENFCHWQLKSIATISFIQLVIVIFMWSSFSLTWKNAFSVGASFLGAWSSYNILGWQWTHARFADWTVLFQNVLREENWSEIIPSIRLYKNYRRPYLLGSLFSVVTFLGCNFLSLHENKTYSVLNWTQIFIGSLTIFSLLFTFHFGNKMPSIEFVALIGIKIFQTMVKISSHVGLSYLANMMDYFWEKIDYDIVNEYFLEYFPKTEFENQYFYNLQPNSILKLIQGVLIIKLLLHGRRAQNYDYGRPLTEFIILAWMHQIINCSNYLPVHEFQVLIGCGTCYLGIIATVVLCRIFNFANMKWIFTGVCIFVVITITMLISLNATFRLDITQFDPLGNGLDKPTYENAAMEELPLTWNEYDLNCHQSAWKVHNLGYTQLSCPMKYDKKWIQWKGSVIIVKLQNKRSDSTNLLFEVFVQLKSEDFAKEQGTWQKFIPLQIDRLFNQHSGTIGPTISLSIPAAESELKLMYFLLSLRQGDEIEFEGKLGNDIGGLIPEVIPVEKIQCIRCQKADYGEFKLVSQNFISFNNYYKWLLESAIGCWEDAWKYVQRVAAQIQEQFSLENSISAIAEE